MSLLIKALKRAERRHDVARQSGDSLPPVPASIAARPAAEAPADVTLIAVDAAEPELQLEVAQFQQQATADEQTLSPAVKNAEADPVIGAMPELPLPSQTQLPQIDFSQPAATLSVTPDPVVNIGEPAVVAPPGLKLSLEDATPTSALASGPHVSGAAAMRIGAGYETAAARPAETRSDSAVRPSDKKQPAAASSTGASTVAARRPRVILYATVAVAFAACVLWLAIEFLGIAPWQRPRASHTASPAMAVPPIAGIATATAPDAGAADSSGKQGGTDARGNSPSRESAESRQAQSARSAETTSAARDRQAFVPGAPGSRRPGTAEAGRETGVAALGKVESVAVRRSEPVSGEVPASAPAVPATGVPAGVRLSRDDTSAQQIVQLNDRAWNALSRNELTAARQAYEASLKLDRNNIDAWLGLASLAARAGDIVNAEQHYRRALDIDPNDGAARAGLLALTAQQEPSTAESRLRGLIDREGAQPPMMFALGNSLAAQQRWAEAQAAYFAAFSGDSTNADYAFNLAISLEHIRQPAMAASYYRKSLELATRRPGRFDRAQVERRLAAIVVAAEVSAKAAPAAAAAVTAEGTRE